MKIFYLILSSVGFIFLLSVATDNQAGAQNITNYNTINALNQSSIQHQFPLRHQLPPPPPPNKTGCYHYDTAGGWKCTSDTNQSLEDKLGLTGPPRSSLQQQLDTARTQDENKQAEEQRNNDLSNVIVLASVGIPLTAGISIAVFYFARKK